MENEQQNLTPKREKFNEKFDGYSDNEVLKELLFTQRIALEKIENNRKNTSNLIWLIVIPIIVYIVINIASQMH